jgi:hypothetical protein
MQLRNSSAQTWSVNGEEGRGHIKLFQPGRILSAKLVISAPFGHPPRCKWRSNDSCSVHRLSEAGTLTILIRDESFITMLLQTFSKKTPRILLDTEPRLSDQVRGAESPSIETYIWSYNYVMAVFTRSSYQIAKSLRLLGLMRFTDESKRQNEHRAKNGLLISSRLLISKWARPDTRNIGRIYPWFPEGGRVEHVRK